MAVLEKEDFWGGKLSKSKNEVTFNPEFEDSELSEVDHKLILSQACLGDKATGRNVVEVKALDYQGEECTHAIVSLREGSNEMCTLNLTFNPPATFKLVEGTGPVHLTGSHIQSLTEEGSDVSDDDSSEDEEIPKLVDTKKQKRPLPFSTPTEPPKKMAKVEDEDSDDEKSDDEEEEESFEAKPAVKADKKKKDSKKPPKVVEKEVEEDDESEDDESEDDDSDDEDFDEEDDDSDDDDDESDEEEESDDEEEDEITAALTAKKKQADAKKPLTNGVASKKAGKEKNTPKAKTPQQKTTKTPQTKTPQTKTPQPPKDIDSIKQALLKSPALPKKMDKFQNFMRSSYKITDKNAVKEVWDFVQKNKK